MSGIYFHIPFCKQACHYCDFHFSTSVKHKESVIEAMHKELLVRKEELKGPVETIYFGGGTPSLLSSAEIGAFLQQVHNIFKVAEKPEITLEANPDDLSKEYLFGLSESGINRMSIGVQSFFEEDLKMMNRAHTAKEARKCLEDAMSQFENISIDLIYGIPGMETNRWEANLQIAFDLEIPHLSCYALTVEPDTALERFISKGIIEPVDDELAKEHYEVLLDLTEEQSFENYEFSNFGKPGFRSKNNTAYWEGRPYLGIGPSAHSFDGDRRSWNIANNIRYFKELAEGNLPLEREVLTPVDKYNEYLMTRLRTISGVSLSEVAKKFGANRLEYLKTQAQPMIGDEILYMDGDTLSVTRKGKFITDGIASRLFLVNLG